MKFKHLFLINFLQYNNGVESMFIILPIAIGFNVLSILTHNFERIREEKVKKTKEEYENVKIQNNIIETTIKQTDTKLNQIKNNIEKINENEELIKNIITETEQIKELLKLKEDHLDNFIKLEEKIKYDKMIKSNEKEIKVLEATNIKLKNDNEIINNTYFQEKIIYLLENFYLTNLHKKIYVSSKGNQKKFIIKNQNIIANNIDSNKQNTLDFLKKYIVICTDHILDINFNLNLLDKIKNINFNFDEKKYFNILNNIEENITLSNEELLYFLQNIETFLNKKSNFTLENLEKIIYFFNEKQQLKIEDEYKSTIYNKLLNNIEELKIKNHFNKQILLLYYICKYMYENNLKLNIKANEGLYYFTINYKKIIDEKLLKELKDNITTTSSIINKVLNNNKPINEQKETLNTPEEILLFMNEIVDENKTNLTDQNKNNKNNNNNMDYYIGEMSRVFNLASNTIPRL